MVSIILDKLSVGINPPEDIVVKARLKESKSLILIKLNKKIIIEYCKYEKLKYLKNRIVYTAIPQQYRCIIQRFRT